MVVKCGNVRCCFCVKFKILNFCLIQLNYCIFRPHLLSVLDLLGVAEDDLGLLRDRAGDRHEIGERSVRGEGEVRGVVRAR